MHVIAYWDINHARIKRVMASIGSSFDVRFAASLGELRSLAAGERLQAVLIGLTREECMGTSNYSRILDIPVDCPVFLLACARAETRIQVPDPEYLLREEDISRISERIAAAIDDRKTSARDRSGIFIGKSAAIRRAAGLVRKYADLKMPVLVLGETGTGKELAAQALHSCSSRRSSAFIAMNCSALPDALVESELFGTEKGAFTDAIRHRGAFAQASEGTLFLDEIGSMSLHAQPRLLRVLESGEYWRLGAEKPEKSDFRLVCASCQNLLEMSKIGSFRLDLLYRISDLVIYLPPLRNRMEDVEDLAKHFCGLAGRGMCAMSGAAIDRLLSHSWPGNVRELKSVINRACADVQSGVIMPDDITFISNFGEAMNVGADSFHATARRIS